MRVEVTARVRQEALSIQVKEVQKEDMQDVMKAIFDSWRESNTLFIEAQLPAEQVAEFRKVLEESPDIVVNFPNEEVAVEIVQEESAAVEKKEKVLTKGDVDTTPIHDLRTLVAKTPWMKIPGYHKMRVKQLRQEMKKQIEEHYGYDKSSK